MYEVILCLLLLTQGICDARKINIGGTNRGFSAARTNLGGVQHGSYQSAGEFRPPAKGHPQQGGHYQQTGVYNPQSSYHPHGNYHQQGHYVPTQSKYVGGTGIGSKSSSSGTFKKALLGGAVGALGGIAVYELGKAILTSKTQPLQAPNGQNYYFDKENHQVKDGYFMCSMPMDEVVKTMQETSSSTPNNGDSGNSTAMTPEQFFKTVQFKDGTRPKSLTWNCKAGSEICCGTDCCPAPQLAAAGSPGHSSRSRGPPWVAIILGILGSIAMLICCCCCLAYKLCRSAFDMCLPSRNTNDNQQSPEVVYTEGPAPTGYDNAPGNIQPSQPSYPEYPQQGGGYPPQYGFNYPSQSYPPQQSHQQQYY